MKNFVLEAQNSHDKKIKKVSLYLILVTCYYKKRKSQFPSKIRFKLVYYPSVQAARGSFDGLWRTTTKEQKASIIQSYWIQIIITCKEKINLG